MRALLEYIGIVLFWLSWPFWYAYFPRHPRTRVLIVHGDEILLLKSWIGGGRWGLPGGGLRSGEDPLYGALREVREETGITLDAQDLQGLDTLEIRYAGLRYRCHNYVVTVTAKPRIRRRTVEISRMAWARYDRLSADTMMPEVPLLLQLVR